MADAYLERVFRRAAREYHRRLLARSRPPRVPWFGVLGAALLVAALLALFAWALRQ